MAALNSAFVPGKLVEARKFRGYSAADLARLIGVTRATVSKYEAGLSEPRHENLWALASALELPTSFFFSQFDAPYEEPETKIIYRSMKSAEIKYRESCEIQTRKLLQIYSFAKKYVQFVDVNCPVFEYSNEPGALDDASIEQLALQCRRAWALGSGPIRNLTRTLEKNGFIITKTSSVGADSNGRIDALSLSLKGRPIIILAAYEKSAVRQRFDEAHELGHRIMHNDMSDEALLNPQKLKAIEKEADKFAAFFLMPEEGFSKDISSTRLDYLTHLKEKWGVSIQSMIMRCLYLEYINEDRYTYLQKQISKLGYRKNEPLDSELPREKPVVMKKALDMIFGGNIISKQEFVEMFEYPAPELEEMLFLENGALASNGDMGQLVELKLK